MHELKNFDYWIEDTATGKFGNGASEKIWLINPETKEKGLFKFPKVKTDNSITGEYWVELLAADIAKLIGIKCAKVNIGTYKGRLGSMSYNILKNNEELNEGITFIQQKYTYYNPDELVEEKDFKKYSVQMIEECISDISDILCIIIFDGLIGNSDRHHSNWGYIANLENELTICPLYDNGSSLCSYIAQEDASTIIKDKMRYNALICTKSKSAIGWDDKRPIKHFELIKNIRNNYYDSTIKCVEKIKNNINELSIKNILDKFDNNIISSKMKELLLRFIIDRKKIILNIYNMKD